MNLSERRKAWFLDRDGTIIVDKHYLGDPDGVEFLPNTIEALRLAQELGYMLIVVTNQSGIARGYFTEADADRVDQKISDELKKYNIQIEKFYRCPHLPDGIPPYNICCECRKPGTGLFEQAIKEYTLDPKCCIACGDKTRDIEGLPKLGIPEQNLGLINSNAYQDILEFITMVKMRTRK